MKISKTRIEKKLARKSNPELKNLVLKLKKQNKLEIASILSLPKRKRVIVNISKLERETKEGDTVIVPGKVLGIGDITHKITIAAFSLSSEARKKLKDCSIKGIEEIVKNKDARIIK